MLHNRLDESINSPAITFCFKDYGAFLEISSEIFEVSNGIFILTFVPVGLRLLPEVELVTVDVPGHEFDATACTTVGTVGIHVAAIGLLEPGAAEQVIID